jgi:glycosyltransferase involved in cell wall biosynthesis
MTNNIAVAMIEPVGGHGGMDFYDFGLSRGLLAAGCSVSLYTCDETPPPDIPGLRFFPVYKRVFGSGNRWLRAFRYLRGSIVSLAMALTHGEQICHLHLFSGEAEAAALVVLSKISGRKVIITVHDVESFSPTAASQSSIRKVYQLADRLIVHNLISKRDLVEKLRISPAKIELIPHGNYLDASHRPCDRYEARSALGLSKSSKTILFFGQIKDTKGLDILIEAIPEVARILPEVTLVIAGRPWKTDFSLYQARIDQLGIKDKCVLHIRYIPNDEITRYFSAADVVVLPYRKIYQSGVILMAMSYGTPVVVSDIPGMTEMITDNVNGYLFSAGSAKSLANRLIRALQDDQGRETVAARALDFIQQNHDWEKIGKMTAELYRTVLNS